jgi:hypothetical protein
VDAYVYFYSIMSMDVSRKQFTNATTDFKDPMNTFVNVAEYPPADFKGVVRSNFDTLYAVSWLDMTKEPVVITAPDTNGRYYLLPMLDMWTDVFASPAGERRAPRPGPFWWRRQAGGRCGYADHLVQRLVQWTCQKTLSGLPEG